MISTGHQWHPQEQESSQMKPQAGEELGHHMAKMAGILVPAWNITDVAQSTSPKQGETELCKQSIFPRKIHLTIPIIPRSGHSGRRGYHARPITSVAGRPVFSGRQRTNNRVEATGQYFRKRKTT
jgi:hypothetical protein